MATRMTKKSTGVATEDVATPVAKKKIQKDYILCRSVTAGGLNITCPSGARYEFYAYGAECEMAYGDLVALVRKHSEHIFIPRIIIEDEDFLAEFPQVANEYSSMYTARGLKEILALPIAQMEEKIKLLPPGAKETIKTIAASEISKGNIDSVKKIKALGDLFGINIDLFSELFCK